MKRVLLGAGGAHLSELQRAIDVLSAKDVVVLLGFQGYPTPSDANQIARVRLLSERLAKTHPMVTIGFADHAAAREFIAFRAGYHGNGRWCNGT